MGWGWGVAHLSGWVTALVGGNKQKANFKESGCERGPAHRQSEEHRGRSALAAACAPCRQAEQKGGGERKRLTAGLLCCHSNCLCIESIEKRFLGFGRLPVFSFPLCCFLSVPIVPPAGFKRLSASAACTETLRQVHPRTQRSRKHRGGGRTPGGGVTSHRHRPGFSTCGQGESRIRSRKPKVFSPRQ